MFRTIEPAILHFGTPVVLVTTLDEDGTTNVAPISSAWWLGWSRILRARRSTLGVRIRRAHVEEPLLMAGHENRIDPLRWRPLVMSFQQFFGLGGIVHPSRLAEIPESAYRVVATRPQAPAQRLEKAS